MYPYAKRIFDFMSSVTILILLSPLLLLVALCIKLDSKGPVFFRQERIGIHKKPFIIYKFRTMYVETPKNVPTAMLLSPEKHITRVGKWIRKTSIDELPQLFNILKGQMSIVGPRPVIAAEAKLIQARTKLGAYSILPGVTGLAQINGRDLIGVQKKAQLDGEYAKKRSFLFDLKVLMSTIAYVLKMNDIAEGIMELPDHTEKLPEIRKKILMLGNSEIVIYNFRLELVERLLADGHEVIISSPHGEKIEKLVKMGCVHDSVEIDRRGTNPVSEIRLLVHYYKLIKKVQPDIVFSYTIKPNIYGALAARKMGVPYVTNVTGLGSAIENKGLLQRFMIQLYRISLSKVQTVFFQNEKNRELFSNHKIAVNKHIVLPGSGVNLKKFNLLKYPSTKKTVNFVFISRIMKEKGIDEFLEAAKKIKEKYPQARFHIAGFFEEEYEKVIEDYAKRKIIQYHGMLSDVRELLSKTHCTILPSYHEGMSNVLLESAASGRPILASNVHGCIETFDEENSGYGFEPQNTKSLVAAIERFLALSHREKENMGLAGRKKMEKEFDRQVVVNNYLQELNKVIEKVLEVR
ncbi:Sugar transferase involved in LPS biosynthesis (colanic, teichoic acid) [Atopostipes suicloacalis DSM 15692]|uniref:Sugar transferase involved in LPS biosynthesis (Colanic, teichoic acid) n=1 Tax=Atopostipes suicloacalis DSM 15692 TaxID=1121025 RepID=A0A1M4WPB9_9LACT|nr:sugar transferase [Atopostipes suicloacalis]SHE83010.1 Sugar transferase involved in LPS biosynthesis (colanic, teichoic acid) [Atopostipes suicloacalis DSM 15692]